MKLVEWAALLPEAYQEEFIDMIDESLLHLQYKNLSQALMSAFRWNSSPSGGAWYYIYRWARQQERTHPNIYIWDRGPLAPLPADEFKPEEQWII